MDRHLHHYVNGFCTDLRAHGGPCGEPQVYRPPTGQGIALDESVPKSLIAPIFRLAAGGYEGTAQQRADSDDVLAWVVPLLDG